MLSCDPISARLEIQFGQGKTEGLKTRVRSLFGHVLGGQTVYSWLLGGQHLVQPKSLWTKVHPTKIYSSQFQKPTASHLSKSPDRPCHCNSPGRLLLPLPALVLPPALAALLPGFAGIGRLKRLA